MNWYVLYTKPRAEKQVAQRIVELGVEMYLPLHKVKRKWSDRVKIVEVPLFNSYIFVKVAQSQLQSLSGINGVSRIVYYLRKPAVVRDAEIEAIKEFLVLAEYSEIIYEGDLVAINQGLFENVTGKVLYVTEKGVALFLEELGAKIFVRREMVAKK
jgi:transcription antitermination factor NusG